MPPGKRRSTGRLKKAPEPGPGQEYWGLDLRLVVVKDWSPRLSTNLDAGYESFFGDRGESLGGFGANFAIGYRLVPWLQPQLELHYGHDFVRVAPDADLLAVTIGVVSSVSNVFCIRTGWQQGVVGRHADKLRTFLLLMDVNF